MCFIKLTLHHKIRGPPLSELSSGFELLLRFRKSDSLYGLKVVDWDQCKKMEIKWPFYLVFQYSCLIASNKNICQPKITKNNDVYSQISNSTQPVSKYILESKVSEKVP